MHALHWCPWSEIEFHAEGNVDGTRAAEEIDID